MISLETYVFQIRDALRTSGAHACYFPTDASRLQANLKLAREIAFGLKDYDRDEVSLVIGSLYGQLIVSNSLDRTGVAISARQWIDEIHSHLTTRHPVHPEDERHLF